MLREIKRMVSGGELKQAIVVRRDLKLGKGKLAAQVSHASVEASEKSRFKREWISGGQKKIVLRCESEKELLDLMGEAEKRSLPYALIRDAGRTQLPPETVTCLGIGPAPDEVLDKVTGRLKLL